MSKAQRARSIISRLKVKSSKQQAQVKEIGIEEELKRLGQYFVGPKTSLMEQRKTELIMRAVDGKLHTWFRGGRSQFTASHLMIDLYENRYGGGESAIKGNLRLRARM